MSHFRVLSLSLALKALASRLSPHPNLCLTFALASGRRVSVRSDAGGFFFFLSHISLCVSFSSSSLFVVLVRRFLPD